MDKTVETEWKPNDELLHMLMDMGISKIAAEHALFYTGNNSAEAAASYVFDNFENDEISLPLGSVNLLQDTDKLKLRDDSVADSAEAENNASDESYFDPDMKYKMVFIVNTNLNMGVGKIAAQVAHATLGLYRMLKEYTMDEAIDNWTYNGEKKVVLKGDNYIHLQELQHQAELNNIHAYLVHDAGKTEVPPDSITVLGLFGEVAAINSVSGSLNLL